MDNPGEILRLCRLCLVKDQVNIPIFEEGDIRQIFLKISSCLPVKVSSDDKLPKKICDGCSNKLDLFYEFWNTSANAEKTLLSWLGQAGVKDADETISAVAQQIAKPAETQVKQEALEDGHANQVQDSFTSQSFEEEAKDESEAPPPKRARRTAAVKAQINITPESDDDDDMDNAEAMTKVEDESEESDGEDKDPSYSEVPGTSADNQAGPSGVGKDGVEAPADCVKVEFHEDKLLTNFLSTTCPQCHKVFKSIAFLKKHLGCHMREVCPSKCNECNKEFKNVTFLRKHMVCHMDARPYKCPACGRAFKRSHEVKNHMVSVHDQSRKFHCNHCTKVFKTKHGFLDHMNRHLKQFVAKCEDCGKGFVTKQEYDAHMDKRHNDNRQILVCFVCGRTCVDKASLTGHLRTHEVGYHDAKFSCDFCGKKFAQKRGLRHHYIRKHKDGGERFVCDLCGKEVNSKRSLKGHMLLHQGAKPVQCPHCEKSFALHSTLKQHILTHTGERPHKCDQCGKCFTQRGPLKAHLRAHSGELPFVCDICCSAFPSKAQLNYHVKNKHIKI